MAVLWRSNAGKLDNVWGEWGGCVSEGGRLRGKADSMASLPKVPSVAGDDTAPRYCSCVPELPRQGAGVIYCQWSTQRLLRLKGCLARGTKRNNCITKCAEWESVKFAFCTFLRLLFMRWTVLFQRRMRFRVLPVFGKAGQHSAVSQHFTK